MNRVLNTDVVINVFFGLVGVLIGWCLGKIEWSDKKETKRKAAKKRS